MTCEVNQSESASTFQSKLTHQKLQKVKSQQNMNSFQSVKDQVIQLEMLQNFKFFYTLEQFSDMGSSLSDSLHLKSLSEFC
jgi:hypothetical protein